MFVCLEHSFIVIRNIFGGVAWSSGQHRSLLLQGSRVQILALPLFFNYKIESKSKSKSRRSKARRDDDEERGKNWQANQEW